jgi:mono/diheme cytochrome c family protein
MRIRLLVALGLLTAFNVASAATTEKKEAMSRGQMLYDNHCLRCHADNVHLRATSKVHSLDDLNHEVRKWVSLQRLDWHEDEIRDVSDFMNHKYYQLTK